MQRPPAPPAVSTNSSNVAPFRSPAGPLDSNIDSLVTNINSIRGRILELLQHIENQPDSLSWPLVMDKFGVISGEMSNLAKQMKHDRAPDYRKHAVVPYKVIQDLDPDVEKMTERRAPSVNHENVPNYLRTKLDPEVEERFTQALIKGTPQHTDAATKTERQITSSNKMVSNLLEQMKTDDFDKTASKVIPQKFYQDGDTAVMLQGMLTGKGLQPASGIRGNPSGTR